MHLFLRMTARSGPTSAGEAVGRRAATAVPTREECGAGRRWPRLAAGQCHPLSDRGPPSERPPDEKRKLVEWWTLDSHTSLTWPAICNVPHDVAQAIHTMMMMMMIGVGNWSRVFIDPLALTALATRPRPSRPRPCSTPLPNC